MEQPTEETVENYWEVVVCSRESGRYVSLIMNPFWVTRRQENATRQNKANLNWTEWNQDTKNKKKIY